MSDLEFGDGGADIGNPAGFIAQSIRDGQSMNESLRSFRESGGSMRNEYWRQTYADVRDAMAREESVPGLTPTAIPDAEDYASWEMGRGGQFASQVTVFVRQKGTGDTGYKSFTYVTDDPHTPAEAEAAAIDEFSDPEVASEYEEVVTGAVTTGIYATVPFQR